MAQMPIAAGDDKAEIDQEAEPQRGTGPLRERAGQQRSASQATDGRGRRDQRGPRLPLRRSEIDQRCRRGAGEDARRQAGQYAAKDQQNETVSGQERHRAQRGQGEPRAQHRPPSDLVGEPAEGEQRGNHARGVRRKDHRDHQLGQCEALSIQDVQRRRQRSAEHRYGQREPGRCEAAPASDSRRWDLRIQ
jgi:hypothetical protein